MDIYHFHNAIKETHPELYTNISHAVDILRKSLHVYTPQELCFSFNGGKDSTVILHLLRYLTYLQERKEQETTHQQGHNDTPSVSSHVSTSTASTSSSSSVSILSGTTDRKNNSVIVSTSSSSSSTDTPVHNNTASLSFLGIKFIYFEAPDNFPAVLEFMKTMEHQYSFILHHVGGFHSGLVRLGNEGIKAVLMGTRKHDPDGTHLDYFTPTSLNWPPCMRICPILHWPYQHIWLFLRGCNVPYCYLYNEGYTSLGSLSDSLPNPCLLRHRKVTKEIINPIDLTISTVLVDEPYYLPAWELENGDTERLGRTKKNKHPSTNTTTTNIPTTVTTSTTATSPVPSTGTLTTNIVNTTHLSTLSVAPSSSFSLTDALLSRSPSVSVSSVSIPTAAIVAIGNELLNGKIMDINIQYLANELRKQGIQVLVTLTIPDSIPTIGTIVHALSLSYTYVFTTGGLGVTHDDNTMKGISLGFNLPLIKNKELEQLQYAMAVSRWRKYTATTSNNCNGNPKENPPNNNPSSLSTVYMEEALNACLRMAYVPTGKDTYLLWTTNTNNNQDLPSISRTVSLSSSSSSTIETTGNISMENLLKEYTEDRVTNILQKGYPLVQVHNVYIFPGVPAILRRKWDTYKSLFQGTTLVTKECCISSVLLVYYGGEALIASILESFTKEFPQYSIGSYPVPHYDSYEPYRTNPSPNISSSFSPTTTSDHDICLTITCTGNDADNEANKGLSLLKERIHQKYPLLNIV